MRPGEKQLWRVLNASAITYLNLAVIYRRVPQPLGLVAMDGVPMNHSDPQGESVDPQTHIALPPGARVEFIVDGPAEGDTGLLVTELWIPGQAEKTIPTGCWRRLSLRRLRPSPARNCEPPRILFPLRPKHGLALSPRCAHGDYIFPKN